MSTRVILISGASRGLGFSLAEHFAKSSRVIGLSRTGKGPQGCENIACDLRNSIEIQSVVDGIIKKYSSVDLLVNNAAVLKSAPLMLTRLEDIEDMIGINFTGSILLSKAVLRPMIARKSGRIVNILSMSHQLKKPGDAVYAATKSAVETFSQILNQEVHSFGITVNNIALSAMPSGMLAPLVKDDPEKIRDLIPHGAYANLNSVIHCIENFCSSEAMDLGGQTLYLGGISA